MSDDKNIPSEMADREATAAYVASQLTRGEDALLSAERRARLSEMVATAGVNDIVQGAQLVVASEDVQALSAVVSALNADDLEDTMEIASISGELSVISDVLYAMDLPVISAFLQDRGERLKELAVDNIMRYGAVRALTEAMDEANRRFGANAVYLAAMHRSLHTAPARIAFTHIPDVAVETTRVAGVRG